MAPMRPSKRPRSHTEDGGSDGINSAGLRRESGKRARLSPATEDDASNSGMSYVAEDVRPSKEKGKGPAEDWEAARDGNFEDLQYQEVDDQHSTQIIAKRYAEAKRRLEEGKINEPAETAVIEEVKCINFMCHERLSVKLGPLINFVIGHNGSGKSAVLTAITLCLGGKATATNRGQNLKSFIKEGQDHAILTVRLKNQGSAAYKPELYGKSIIVERTFSKFGSNGYKIKNVNDRTVTTKKADLDDILDAFSLQLDNPMNVLTQDMARQFLNHSGPKEKYKFFLKGTQLEALDNDYRLLSDTIGMIESKYDILVETINTRKRALDEVSDRKKRADKLQSLHQKIEQLGWQMAWVQVAEQEERLSDLDNMIQGQDKKIDRQKEEADEASRRYDTANQALEAAKDSLKVLQDSLAPIRDRTAAAKEKWDASEKEGRDIVKQQRDINTAIVNANNMINKYSALIQEERRRQEQADGGQHAQKLADIQEAKAKAAQAKAALEAHRESHATVVNNLDKADKEVKSIAPALSQKGQQVRAKQMQIESLQKDQGNWSAGYDANLPRLLRAIETERRFKDAPVGPMGRHVRLLKPEWSSVLERQAGQSLSSFVVTSKADEAILSDLMKQTRCVSPILIGKPRPLDTSNHEPSAELETWMRVLKFDNDLVRNQMIIGQGIDQTVLIKDRETASAFIAGDVRPQNVKQVYALHDTRRGAGHQFQLNQSGGLKLGPIHPWEGRARMQTDLESQLSFEKETLVQLQQDFKKTQMDERALRKNVDECNRAIEKHRSVERDLRIKHQRAEDHTAQLKDELEAETPQKGNMDTYERILHENEGEKEMQEAALGDAIEARAQWDPVNADLKNELRSLEEEIKDVEARIHKATGKCGKLKDARESALQQKNLAMETLASFGREKDRIAEERQSQADTVEEWIREASKLSSRVPVDPNETHDSLEKKREKLKRDLQVGQAEVGGSRRELEVAEMEAKADFDAARKTKDSSLALVHVLKEALIDRKDRWAKFRRWIQSAARITFVYLLSERSFRGSLSISSQTKQLDIKVEPDITKSDQGGRQTKTLSGGEKSFSTICLLLALWDAMGSPIRCLDEFDVFMDNVNRDISMKMMIEAARRSVGRQYILITPQAMGSVSIQEDVRIIKMSDPVRGQTTLPFAG